VTYYKSWIEKKKKKERKKEKEKRNGGGVNDLTALEIRALIQSIVISEKVGVSFQVWRKCETQTGTRLFS
jgi:hypothetical protein